MLAKDFGRLMKNPRFKKKFSERLRIQEVLSVLSAPALGT
jgi:hypothetical protein